MSFDADVVVIGAGLAGLRAAADLQARGPHYCVVLYSVSESPMRE